MTGIYIHLPFCAAKCPYCGFFSIPYDETAAGKYIDAVIRNIAAYERSAGIDSIYFGGGTPSVLPAIYIHAVLEEIYRRFNVYNPEITIEINPGTADRGKLSDFKSSGVNRLSFGVQSCIDGELKSLGRAHTISGAKNIILTAATLGFENISCDLMLGIPGQDTDSAVFSLEELISLPVRHISAYMLKIEKNTPFDSREVISSLPSEDAVADMYLYLVSYLNENGFPQYEISNFAENGFECRHNLKYWLCGEYIGIGASAHSHFRGRRYAVPGDIRAFISSERQTEIITEENPSSFEEKAMLALRLNQGLRLSAFPEQKDFIVQNAAGLAEYGLLNITDDTVSLTPKGFLVSNTVIGKLILDG